MGLLWQSHRKRERRKEGVVDLDLVARGGEEDEVAVVVDEAAQVTVRLPHLHLHLQATRLVRVPPDPRQHLLRNLQRYPKRRFRMVRMVGAGVDMRWA